jgi:hypothetical protein
MSTVGRRLAHRTLPSQAIEESHNGTEKRTNGSLLRSHLGIVLNPHHAGCRRCSQQTLGQSRHDIDDHTHFDGVVLPAEWPIIAAPDDAGPAKRWCLSC